MHLVQKLGFHCRKHDLGLPVSICHVQRAFPTAIPLAVCSLIWTTVRINVTDWVTGLDCLALQYCATYSWVIIGIHGKTQICSCRGRSLNGKLLAGRPRSRLLFYSVIQALKRDTGPSAFQLY